MKYIIFFLFLFTVDTLFCANNDLKKINFKFSLKYGLELFNNNDYYRAITEFKRYNFFIKNKHNNDMASYYMGLSYFKGGEFKKAKNVFYSILESDNNDFIEDSYIRLGDISFQREFQKVVQHKYYDFSLPDFNPDNYFHYLNNYRTAGKYSDEALSKILFSYMLNFNLGKSAYFMNSMKFRDKKYKSIVYDLKKDFYRIKNVSEKSAAFATVLSIVIPGAGQIYAGEVKEGFIALGVNASFITLSILAYKNYSKFVGLLLGYYELTFYFGNINNAQHAVNKYNENQRNKVRRYLIDLYWKKF